ncbi:nuclear migration protein, putative [Talaromyces stipitatus ATCC 10500]|uniref:Nuclear migration protein, putative n=1 Tax=Talaromyces stipitatus (strain ATCC 10500 / CBS 375.48 / QM 6759 / NRRL 1006) TaxID=441959 RepID=B8M115_TALSN|nr:nuclear migration protein, putative [Talaromyces stipitatus ATCC 10500]EED21795.1 nuclear migration protein, putative [Talaromyces stipitatus ATCC 10500]
MDGTMPSPPPVPFRAPSRATSHHRRNSSMGDISSSPFEPFSPVVDDLDVGSDNVEEEPFSAFDPRRFTPTLHANLVSEILSLRRELEGKNKEIAKLETSLDESQNENEMMNENITKVTKENRSLKKQMQLLEGGTLSAITEIAKERDDAVENITDVRKRLEQAQKKLKSKEEEVDRSQSLWERDRENWDTERRNWERKVHVVENRLKTILNEVAAAQAAGNFQKLNDPDEDTTKDNSTTLDSASVRSSSAFDRRRTSASSASTYDGEPLNSGRFSSMSFANANGVKGEGFNLADELALDEDEEDYMDLIEEIPGMRPLSVASQSSLNAALKARKILGLSMDESVTMGMKELINLDGSAPTTNEPEVKREYRDIGTQYTPPASPQLPPSDLAAVEDPNSKSEIIETVVPEMKDIAVETFSAEMLSTSCQTDDVIISIPASEPDVDAEVSAEPAKIPTVSVCTQTDMIFEEDESKRSLKVENQQPSPQTTPTVPTIAIIPPGSEPATPRTSLVLPPHTKSIACQTEYEQSYDMRSVGMQTEAIQVDQRPVKLPASLLPSAIFDKTDKVDSESISLPFMSPPPRSPRRPLNKTFDSKDKDKKAKNLPDLVQAYPGNNDNGPLAEDDTSDIRRPLRSSSLFAGFDDTNDDESLEVPAELPDVFSDDEIFNRPMASYTLRSGRMVNRSRLSSDTLREEDEFDIDLPSNLHTGDSLGRKTLSSKSSTGSKQSDIRRSALITSGAVAHQRNRPRSPSDPSIDSASTGAARPPFPVPVRLSSRNVQTTRSESNQSPTPYSDGNSSTGRRSRRITRQPTLRKVRSATAMQKNQQERAGSRSPPPMSASGMSNSSYAPDSPQLPPLPPMPTDEPVIYRPKRTARRIPSSRPGSIRSQAQSYSVEEPSSDHVQSTNVVDAIAQTMVGEWMFKYVRRRKSFGMSDNKDTIDPTKSTEEVSASITSTGVRHKRWVWLAPYERAVMWSSKQPTSGPALLGKNGRKLIIQSVLDVKDDTPLPKGSNVQAPFNRSILILTPQRALKFTAMSLDRHYVWLTALSFLSHTSIGMGELPSIPPPIPQEEYAARPPTASLRRNPIRDSIRVAKGKPRPQPSKRSFTDNSHNSEYTGTGFDLEPIMDAADPPTVPRYAGHTRKRSNTAPKAPLSAPLTSAFRSFSSHATLPSNYSAITAASSDIYASSSIGAPSGLMSGRSSVSRRTSEASGPTSSIVNGGFFDPMGTVRMEAFIERVDNPRSRVTNHMSHSQRNRAYRKRDNVQWNTGNDFDLPRSEDGSEIYYRNDELFRGF